MVSQDLIDISSGNDLSPFGGQAITQWLLIANWILGNKISEISIKLQNFSFQKIHKIWKWHMQNGENFVQASGKADEDKSW